MTMPRRSPNSRDGTKKPFSTRLLIGLCVILMLYVYTVFHTDEEGRFSNSFLSSYGFGSSYHQSPLETYVMENSERLGYHRGTEAVPVDACPIWRLANESIIYDHLQTYRSELNQYNRLLQKFRGAPVDDVRLHLEEGICDKLEVKKGGLQSIFTSGSLSRVGDAGFVEPMLPPFRHPGICFDYQKNLMNMGYLVHDFGAMCRKLKRHSRTVFVDMGAALDFHEKKGTTNIPPPAMYVTHMYKRFGFKFDHIYAYELKPKDPADVYSRIPDDLRASYHWFNVGVDSDPKSPNNPLKMIKENFNEDDFIVVKLDIDTSFIEVPLAYSLLTDEKLLKLVDVFYFEHHIYMLPVWANWGLNKKSAENANGTIEQSMKLFTDIRKKGIASHSWP